MQQTFIGCIQQLSGSSEVWTIRCYWPCSGPDTPVTKHEAADLVHCFPDDLVSQGCDVFVQYARQHDQEQEVRAWAEQLTADIYACSAHAHG